MVIKDKNTARLRIQDCQLFLTEQQLEFTQILVELVRIFFLFTILFSVITTPSSKIHARNLPFTTLTDPKLWLFTACGYVKSQAAPEQSKKGKQNKGFYLYSSSSIKVPEKGVTEGEIEPGLEEKFFINVGDWAVSADIADLLSAAIFVFVNLALVTACEGDLKGEREGQVGQKNGSYSWSKYKYSSSRC